MAASQTIKQQDSPLAARRRVVEQALVAFDEASIRLAEIIPRSGSFPGRANRSLLMGRRVFRPLYGTGMPSSLVHAYCGGNGAFNLTGLICPATSVTSQGYVLVDELADAGATDMACMRASELVTAYDRGVGAVIAHSEILSQVIGIRGTVSPPSGASIAFLEGLFDAEVTAASCPSVIEHGFGDLFYRFLANVLTLEAFEVYRRPLRGALVDLIEELPAA